MLLKTFAAVACRVLRGFLFFGFQLFSNKKLHYVLLLFMARLFNYELLKGLNNLNYKSFLMSEKGM